MENIDILLVGIGGYGENYIKELTEKNIDSVRIVGICDIQDHIPGKYPIVQREHIPVYATPEAFYLEHTADLAIISTPIHLHFSQARTCLLGGSNVLIEKPVCTTPEGAGKLMKLERQTGRFVAVGYQLNYSGDVKRLKEDILTGRYGKPISLKAIHAMRRGRNYYRRNNWAGHITVDGCMVNDSPFNNACAHQFQNMTFLLGNGMDRAAEVSDIQASLYRANREIENYDTAAIRAVTNGGIPIYYYTSHTLKEKSLGPYCEYRFEGATIYYGKDFGKGAVMDYVAVTNDGRICSYAGVDKGKRLQKMYDAIAAVRNGSHPISTIACALPHLEAVTKLAGLPVITPDDSQIEVEQVDGDQFTYVKNIEKILWNCFDANQLPSSSAFSEFGTFATEVHSVQEVVSHIAK